ncbi:MAG: MarC family protein [Candidatus Nitrosocaldus sp.]|nr:MarC family protein [Candidatus Nitrosocaldus sp.]MCS7141272.1 MarC family protein [Candidatus Nitrosocaldus sp.]MDW8000237.1 MarC family protein [Candidatus Nitrosocaldus sp.]MDW8275999.1 MarC family protein [Candidatus Nitrosocaldus sp.]
MSDPIINTDDLIRVSVSLFIVMDPIGLVPLMASLTSNMSSEQSRRVIRSTIYTASGLLLTFALAGHYILDLFDISLAGFSVAGGLLLLLISLQLLLKGWELKGDDISIGAVPLAFPLLVGPGAITTTIISLERHGIPLTMLSVAIALAFTMLTFSFINRINRLLGSLGSLIVSRVMAILIAGIAIEFIVSGIKEFMMAG